MTNDISETGDILRALAELRETLLQHGYGDLADMVSEPIAVVLTAKRAIMAAEARATRLMAALQSCLNCLPDSFHDDDETWAWCWNELSVEAQDQVKNARRTALPDRRHHD